MVSIKEELRMTKEDIDFIKSMCFQGPDMTTRQENRVRRIIDDMRMIVFEMEKRRADSEFRG